MFSMIPPFEFDLDIAAKIAPLSIIYVLMLTLNNFCLQLVEVTFYQVARSLSIFFNILFTWLLLRQSTSVGAMFACAVVVLGFFVGSYGETNFSWPGLLAGVGSSIFVALYGIYVKKTLAVIDNNQWRLLHYNTAISIGLLAVLTLFSGELTEIRQEVYFLGDLGFWFLMTLTGVAGFMINTAMFLQIKYTTALTNTISGTAKSCVQTLMAMVFYQNPISAMVRKKERLFFSFSFSVSLMFVNLSLPSTSLLERIRYLFESARLRIVLMGPICRNATSKLETGQSNVHPLFASSSFMSTSLSYKLHNYLTTSKTLKKNPPFSKNV